MHVFEMCKEIRVPIENMHTQHKQARAGFEPKTSALRGKCDNPA